MYAKTSYFVHFLEGSTEVLNTFLRQLHQETKGEKPYYSLINILGFNEQTPQRYYRSWKKESSILTGTVPGESDKTETQLSERVAQIFQSFCQAGIKSLTEEVRLQNEIIITNDDLAMMTARQFTSIEEYHQIYLDDLEIDLDQEHLYPFQPSITRVLEFSDSGTLSNLVNKYV